MYRKKFSCDHRANMAAAIGSSMRWTLRAPAPSADSRIARRSTCTRLDVGTVITTTDYRKVLAVGYNGNASGLPNSCDRDEPGNCGCLHSEENAVINCDAPQRSLIIYL